MNPNYLLACAQSIQDEADADDRVLTDQELRQVEKLLDAAEMHPRLGRRTSPEQIEVRT